MQKNRKAGATNTGSNQKTFVNAGAINNAFDVFDFTQKVENSQQVCFACNPLVKNQDVAKLCAEHRAETNALATAIFGQFAPNRKAVRLHQCSDCRRCITPSKFSRDWGICKSCVADVQEKSKIARSNFITRTVNNFHKMLKGVAAL